MSVTAPQDTSLSCRPGPSGHGLVEDLTCMVLPPIEVHHLPDSQDNSGLTGAFREATKHHLLALGSFTSFYTFGNSSVSD